VYAGDVGDGVLTARQGEILEAMAGGLTNREIAKLIRFSESTVRVESLIIYRHFGVHSRGEAVEAAREAGDIDDPPDRPGIDRIAV
jgi:DNA-binding NarL/FixJ family response regulator